MSAWDRRAGETPQAYAAFQAYRDMGAGRSTAKVGQQLGKSKDLMDRWCSRWQWVKRAAAWDAEQDRLKQEQQRAEIAAMAKRHADIAHAMQAKIVSRLRAINPDELDPGQLAKWLDVAVRIEREARFGPPKHHLHVVGKDGGAIEHSHTHAVREAEASLARLLGVVLADGAETGVANDTDP